MNKLETKAIDKQSPAYRSFAHRRLASSWKLVSDLWGSVLDVREKGTEYLPRFKKEPEEKYRERLTRSVYMNGFRHSIESMAGMVFRTDPQPTGVHPNIAEMLPDIDLCGNSFWSFNIDNFQLFLRDGNGYIYVDAPPMSDAAREAVEEGRKPSLKDRVGERPYLIYYKASQVLSTRWEQRGSLEVLVQAVIEETVIENDGAFGEQMVTQYRVLRPRKWEVHQKGEDGKINLIKEGSTGTEEIRLIPIVRDQMNAPPLLTLAALDVLYYQQTSDYDNICHMVNSPLRVDRYDTQEDAKAAGKMQTASAGIGLKIWGEKADVKYVEVSGSGMALTRERYNDIKAEKAAIGVGMLAPDDLAGPRTATEVADIAGQRQSKLANLTRQWENAMEKALYFMAEFINEIRGKNTINLNDAEKAKLKLKIDYNRLTFDMDQLGFFSELVDSGKLSLRTFLEWLPQVADMPPGFDPREELKRIAAVNSISDDDLEDDETPEGQEKEDPDKE